MGFPNVLYVTFKLIFVLGLAYGMVELVWILLHWRELIREMRELRRENDLKRNQD